MKKTLKEKPIDIEEIHEEVRQRLLADDQKYTKSRRKLIEALANKTAPTTLPEIVSTYPELASSSAYRNLDILFECKVITKIVSEGHNHFELAEPFKAHHHHLICLTCGDVADVNLDIETEKAIDKCLNKKAKKLNFTPVNHTLDLFGYCLNCA